MCAPAHTYTHTHNVSNTRTTNPPRFFHYIQIKNILAGFGSRKKIYAKSSASPADSASVWGGGGGGAVGSATSLQLADEAAGHAAGGVVPAADGHPRQNPSLDDVTAVLVNVVVGLAHFPEPGERRGGWAKIHSNGRMTPKKNTEEEAEEGRGK